MVMDVKSSLQQACRLLLRPIASVLMKCGMTWKEFSEISKSVFVDVASEEYGIRGRPTNVSRVSILTGISRKEVKRQRELLATVDAPVQSKTTDATRVLSGWHQDPDYLGDSGDPLPLPEHGPVPSFESLFSSYGGDTPGQTLIKELRRAKSVELNDASLLIVKSRYYMPVQISEEWISMAGQFLHDLGVNINYNMEADEKRKSRFLGFAMDHQIDPSAVAKFRDFMEEQGQDFLQKTDDWLAQHSIASDADADATPVRLGVALFTIHDETK